MISKLSKRRGQRGFTLIELMIVVAIIGILAAIAIPNFISFKKKAILSAAVANLETVRSAMSQFAADDDAGCYPTEASIAAYGPGVNTLLGTLADYGLTFPNNPSGVKWDSFDSYDRDDTDCTLYTVDITAADGATQFKALPKGTCCVDSDNCTSYAKNVAQCTADFGL